MSVIRPVTRSILSSVIRSVIRTDVISRYFTQLESAAMKRFNIPQVLSGQSITMDVYPTNGNAGLPLGAPAVTDNVFQTITFTLTGNMDFIGYDGTDYFNGYIANVSVAGRLYKVNENFAETNVLTDSLLGQNGTAVNISESDLFTQDDAGDWLGVERFNIVSAIGDGWTQIGANSFVSDGSQTASSQVRDNTSSHVVGEVLRFTFDIVTVSSGGAQAFIAGPTVNGTLETTVGAKLYDSNITAIGTGIGVSCSATFVGQVDNMSSKQLLEAE